MKESNPKFRKDFDLKFLFETIWNMKHVSMLNIRFLANLILKTLKT